MMQLLVWAYTAWNNVLNDGFISLIYNSVLLATFASIISLLVAFSVNYCQRIIPNNIMIFIFRFISIGYALPGTIIAIGIIIPLAFIDHKIDEFLGSYLRMSFGLIFRLLNKLFLTKSKLFNLFLFFSINNLESNNSHDLLKLFNFNCSVQYAYINL